MLAELAGLASGLGSLASGVSGFFGGGSNGPGLKKLVKHARQLGLHPLSVLGSPIAGNYATPAAARDVGSAFAGIGEGLGQMGAAWSARKDAAEVKERQRRQDDIQAQKTGSETMLNLAQARALDRQGGPEEVMSGAQTHTAAAQANSKRPLNLWGFELTPGSGGGVPSAQDVEDEYADVGSNIYALGRLASDIPASMRSKMGQYVADDVARFLDAMDQLEQHRNARRNRDYTPDEFNIYP